MNNVRDTAAVILFAIIYLHYTERYDFQLTASDI